MSGRAQLTGPFPYFSVEKCPHCTAGGLFSSSVCGGTESTCEEEVVYQVLLITFCLFGKELLSHVSSVFVSGEILPAGFVN